MKVESLPGCARLGWVPAPRWIPAPATTPVSLSLACIKFLLCMELPNSTEAFQKT